MAYPTNGAGMDQGVRSSNVASTSITSAAVKDGRLVDQLGRPVSDADSIAVFGKPASEMVAQLTGQQNVIDGVPGATGGVGEVDLPSADEVLGNRPGSNEPRKPINLNDLSAAVSPNAMAPTGSSFRPGSGGSHYTPPTLGDLSDYFTTDPVGHGDGDPTTGEPGGEAPTVDTSRADAVISDIDQIRSYLFGLAGQKKNFSVAEAQLRNAGVAAERSALGQARAGNRRDRAMLERQAIAEGANIQQGIARDAALLRAQEEDQNLRFSADTAAKAAELGLNETAVLIDVSKADLDSATNWINNEFQQIGIDKQLNQQESEMLLNYARDMAMIEYEYEKLSVDDRNHADALLMQKYGIDQQTMVGLKQIKESGKFRWDQFATTLVAGGVQGGITALGAKLFS